MSSETEKPEIQPDESQKIEQVKTLPKPGEEPLRADREVANDQPSQEGEPKATEEVEFGMQVGSFVF